MKFWTFQRHDKIFTGVPIMPVWSRGGRIAGASLDAYLYILDIFNGKYGRHDAGLIFGYAGFQTQDEIYARIDRYGAPSGAHFPAETHTLLELEIPDDTPMITIDFYRFSDLIFCFENGDDETLTLDLAQRDLFFPNNPDGSYEIPVSNIPYILPEWIVAQHTPRY